MTVAQGGVSGELLDFDAWARLSARLLKRSEGERAAILGAEHVEPGAYRASDAHWSRLLSADLEAGRTRRAERYGEACAAELRTRTPLPVAPAEPVPEATPLPEPAPASVEVEVPSFMREGLPFHAYVAEPALPLPEIREPAPAPPPPDPSGTVDVEAILARPVLPFVAPGSAPPPPPEAYHHAEAPHHTAGATQAVHALRAQAALPFVSARQAARTSTLSADEVSVAGFTMHQYASLCAELAVYAHQTGAVLLRYGLPDEGARRHLADQWQQRLVGDPALLHAWTELCAQYRDWLAQQRR